MLYFSFNLTRAICLEKDCLPKTSQFYHLTAKLNIHVKIQYNCSITDLQFEQRGPLKVINVLQYQAKKKGLGKIRVSSSCRFLLPKDRKGCLFPHSGNSLSALNFQKRFPNSFHKIFKILIINLKEQ